MASRVEPDALDSGQGLLRQREHPASRSPGHSRSSSTTSSIDAVPTRLPDLQDIAEAQEGSSKDLDDKVKRLHIDSRDDETSDEEDVTTPTGNAPHYASFSSLGADNNVNTTRVSSPLRHEAVGSTTADRAQDDDEVVHQAQDESSRHEDVPSSQVTFSVPGHGKTADTAKETNASESVPTEATGEHLLGTTEEADSPSSRLAIYTPSHDTRNQPHSPLGTAPNHLHSILKTSSSPMSSSRRSSFSENEDEPSNTAANAQRPAIHLQPPSSHFSRRGRDVTSSSRSRSSSPAVDRTRIVGGKDGYGGRKGGPALDKSRTGSSGGLSEVHMSAGYERKVGFDTMIDADDTPNGYFTFCLQVKSRGYRRTKNTRTFMCAVDDNGYSERALEWLMESLVSDGDEIVALRVLEEDPDTIDQDAARDEARDLMARIVQLNDEYGDRSISIVIEFVAGRATSTILGLIYMYRPDSLTVGTRGRSVSTIQKMFGNSFMGSCSRDILNRSPVPVVIVRPEAKVKKHLVKRQNDPRRRSYHDLVALSKDEHLPLSVSRSSARRQAKHAHTKSESS